jgi:hypothetical protein
MAEVLTLKLLVTHLGDGRTTEVLVAVGEQTSSIAAVKERISELDGIEAANQYLFRLGCELGDDEVIRRSCELYLFVGDTKFKWDSAGEAAAAGGIYALVNATTMRRVHLPLPPNVRVDNRMRMLPSMRGGIFAISLKFTRPDVAAAAAAAGITPRRMNFFPRPYVHCGLVGSDPTNGLPWFGAMMATWTDGPVWPGYKNQPPLLRLGSVLTMQWDASTCTLKYFMDGMLQCSVVHDSVRGITMQWGVDAPCRGTVIEIVGNPPGVL